LWRRCGRQESVTHLSKRFDLVRSTVPLGSANRQIQRGNFTVAKPTVADVIDIAQGPPAAALAIRDYINQRKHVFERTRHASRRPLINGELFHDVAQGHAAVTRLGHFCQPEQVLRFGE
jgi:hypothetical protein